MQPYEIQHRLKDLDPSDSTPPPDLIHNHTNHPHNRKRCHHCGADSHLKAQCNQIQNHLPQHPNPQPHHFLTDNPTNTMRNNKSCWTCGSPDHIKRDCKHKYSDLRRHRNNNNTLRSHPHRSPLLHGTQLRRKAQRTRPPIDNTNPPPTGFSALPREIQLLIFTFAAEAVTEKIRDIRPRTAQLELRRYGAYAIHQPQGGHTHYGIWESPVLGIRLWVQPKQIRSWRGYLKLMHTSRTARVAVFEYWRRGPRGWHSNLIAHYAAQTLLLRTLICEELILLDDTQLRFNFVHGNKAKRAEIKDKMKKDAETEAKRWGDKFDPSLDSP